MKKFLICISALLLTACTGVDSSTAVDNAASSEMQSDESANDTSDESTSSEADEIKPKYNEDYSDLLNSAAELSEREELSDFDRILRDVANFTKEDFEEFQKDYFSITRKFSGEYLPINDEVTDIFRFKYGEYLLFIDRFAGSHPDPQAENPYDLPWIVSEDVLGFSICWEMNSKFSGVSYPYVSIRQIYKDGTDLPVEDYTHEEIDDIIYWRVDPPEAEGIRIYDSSVTEEDGT